ncbi:MAG: hypothetical protein II453_11155 [Alphaproteobacteria bacterium]|nr:hypothetical protein [Alphaproteobacteria bacterium]
MIDRKQLKKGDHVLEIASSYGSRSADQVTELVVVSIGPKYISCQRSYDGEAFGSIRKYHNDEHMGLQDWGQWKLFLGTKEEYMQKLEEQKECSGLYYEIDQMFHRDLGYDKLMAIKTIIEADSLDEALAKMHCVRLPK